MKYVILTNGVFYAIRKIMRTLLFRFICWVRTYLLARELKFKVKAELSKAEPADSLQFAKAYAKEASDLVIRKMTDAMAFYEHAVKRLMTANVPPCDLDQFADTLESSRMELLRKKQSYVEKEWFGGNDDLRSAFDSSDAKYTELVARLRDRADSIRAMRRE